MILWSKKYFVKQSYLLIDVMKRSVALLFPKRAASFTIDRAIRE